MHQGSQYACSSSGSEAERLHAALVTILSSGERVALCTILRMVGSAPRRAGAKMLVRRSGELTSTIGGGLLEGRAAAWGREILATGGASCHRFVLTSAEAGGDGMACGGEVEVLVERLDGDHAGVAEFFGHVHHLITTGTPGWLIVGLHRDGDAVVPGRALCAGGQVVATFPARGGSVPDDLLRAAPHGPLLVERGGVRYFLEPLAPPITVIVCGAGHIAVQLVPLCHLLGFRTVVVDDRAEFASLARFPLASQLVVVPSFARALEGLASGRDAFVVIVTRGHAGDLAVVREALRGQPGYIGMIGSRKKREAVFEALVRNGCGADELSRVTCPIGLPIGAETPEEIAVSIVAQLVATRAARRHHS